MAKVIPITERFQRFVAELQESFWGDLQGQTRAAWKKFFELDWERVRDRYAGWNRYRRGPRKAGGYRNGYYSRDFATTFGTIRLRIARARGKAFYRRVSGDFSGGRRSWRCWCEKRFYAAFPRAKWGGW